MRKLNKKQLLAKMFLACFALCSLLSTSFVIKAEDQCDASFIVKDKSKNNEVKDKGTINTKPEWYYVYDKTADKLLAEVNLNLNNSNPYKPFSIDLIYCQCATDTKSVVSFKVTDNELLINGKDSSIKIQVPSVAYVNFPQVVDYSKRGGGEASNNTLLLNNLTIMDCALALHVEGKKGDALREDKVGGSISANNNKLIIKNSLLSDSPENNFWGSVVYIDNRNNQSKASNNELSISDTKYDGKDISVYGALINNIDLKFSSREENLQVIPEACENVVNIDNMTCKNPNLYVTGGRVAIVGKANKNKVNLTNTKSKPSYGSTVITGGLIAQLEELDNYLPHSSEANENSVFVDNACFNDTVTIMGGQVYTCEVAKSNKSSANYNKVTISNCDFLNKEHMPQRIIGGEARYADNNSISLTNIEMNGSVDICGGYTTAISEAYVKGIFGNYSADDVRTFGYDGEYAVIGKTEKTDEDGKIVKENLPMVDYEGNLFNQKKQVIDHSLNSYTYDIGNDIKITLVRKNDKVNKVVDEKGKTIFENGCRLDYNGKPVIMGIQVDDDGNFIIDKDIDTKTSACNNSISLKKVKIKGEYPAQIYGGYVSCPEFDEANNNSITIENVDLYAFLLGSNKTSGFQGNTLNVVGKNNKVKYLHNYLYEYNEETEEATEENVIGFDKLNFVFTEDMKSGDTMLTVNDSDEGVPPLPLSLRPVTSLCVNTGAIRTWKKDDYINLIVNDCGFANYDNIAKKDSNIVELKGLTTLEAEVKVDDKALKLQLLQDVKEKQNANTKAPAEGIAAAAALVNESGNLISGGLSESMVSSIDGNTNTFATIGGGKARHKTGSHVDSRSWNLGAGIGKKIQNTTYGLFFTYGKSHFDTYNVGMVGNGKSTAFSGGLMFHHESSDKNYFDGSFYLGKVKADWKNSIVGGYDDKASYHGFNFGVGKKSDLSSGRELDIYGRYMHSRTNAMSGNVGGIKYDFGAVKSSRIRLGFRVEASKKAHNARPYWGLGFEREFKGNAESTMHLGKVDAPSLKGNSGIAELGYKWSRGAWDFALSCEGSWGKRQSVNGSLNAFYNF